VPKSKPKPPPRRGRTPMPAAERKDRLVQTRVPEDLDTTLREQASRKRVSVSQLIRNVLEDTFDLVDNVVAETASFTQAVKRDAKRIAASAKGIARTPALLKTPARLSKVYAWQEVVLNREARCARCGAELAKGDKALFGLEDQPSAPKPWICVPCAAEL